jgi:hypothetical protein
MVYRRGGPNKYKLRNIHCSLNDILALDIRWFDGDDSNFLEAISATREAKIWEQIRRAKRLNLKPLTKEETDRLVQKYLEGIGNGRSH